MASHPTANPPAVVVDASFAIGWCAKEDDKFAAADAKLQTYAIDGFQLFAPNVMAAEVLYGLCKKVENGTLDDLGHDEAIQNFLHLMSHIRPPVNGDASLIARARQIRGAYSCRRCNDAIYLALAEQIQQDQQTEVVTFDEGLKKHAKSSAASVTVEVLPVAPSP